MTSLIDGAFNLLCAYLVIGFIWHMAVSIYKGF